jgi:RHS repeat-associated protein
LYGAFGDLVEINKGEISTLVLTRDDYGRVLTSSQPDRGTELAGVIYNGLNEAVYTSDHGGRHRDLFYDDFGRLEHATDNDGLTQWIYDVDISGEGHDTIGRLVRTISPSGQTVDYGYMGPEAGKNRGLLNNITDHLASPLGGGGTVDLAVDYRHDDFSRLTRIDYPAVSGVRFGVQYGFDPAGHVTSARQPDELRTGSDPATVYWELLDPPDQGMRIKRERLGSTGCSGAGVVTTRHFDDHTGDLVDLQSACGSDVFQHWTYRYNDSGNMTLRTDEVANRSETFGYDTAGRIQDIDGQVAFRYANNRHGIGFQSGVGTYSEQWGDELDPANIYWTGQAGDNIYRHNAAGAQHARSGPGVHGTTQSITYTTFDLPTHVLQGTNHTADFTYDAGGTRTTKAVATSGTAGDVTYYMGDLFQRVVHPTGATTNRHMIYAGGRLIGIATASDSDPTHPTLRYLHEEALGSIQNVTNANGTVEAARDFSVFGVERGGQPHFDDVPYGFTGQEHDADLGLINMHGRIYDPVLAEFLSPDPYMPTPYGHGLNAFAYVNNRPLDFTDPSGFQSLPTVQEIGEEHYGYVFSDDPLTGYRHAAGVPQGPMGTGAMAESIGAGLPTGGSLANTVMWGIQIGIGIAEILTRDPSSDRAQGVTPGRSPQAPGSTVGKPPANPVQPAALDPGHHMWQPQEGGYEGSPGDVGSGTGGTGPRTDLQRATDDCEVGQSDCLGNGFGALVSAAAPQLMPGQSLEEIRAANSLRGAAQRAPEELLVTVQHFTSIEGAAAIEGSGALRAGSYVALPGDVAGLSSMEVEEALVIQQGRGAMTAQFQTPYSNLVTPANGPFASARALQFQIVKPITVGPGTFVPVGW